MTPIAANGIAAYQTAWNESRYACLRAETDASKIEGVIPGTAANPFVSPVVRPVRSISTDEGGRPSPIATTATLGKLFAISPWNMATPDVRMY